MFSFLSAVHAAVIAINTAIDKQVPSDTMSALRNPNTLLVNIHEDNQDSYQDCLYEAKLAKAQIALNKVFFITSLIWQKTHT